MNHKAQVGKIFMYAAGMIIAVMFFIYGVRLIMNLTDAYEDISFEQFKTDLITDMDFVAKNYGSSKVVELRMPLEYSTIVFADYLSSGNCNYGISQIANECELYWNSVGVDDIEYNNIFLCDDPSCSKLLPLGVYEGINLGIDIKTFDSSNGFIELKLINLPGGQVNITRN